MGQATHLDILGALPEYKPSSTLEKQAEPVPCREVGGEGVAHELRAAEVPPTPESQAEWVQTWAEAGCGHLHRSSGGGRLHYCER